MSSGLRRTLDGGVRRWWHLWPVLVLFAAVPGSLEPFTAAPDEPVLSLEEWNDRLPEQASAVAEALSVLIARESKPSAWRAEAHIIRGKAYWFLEDLEAALADYLAALGLISPEDSLLRARILMNAGAVYYELDSFEEAEPLFREALELGESLANGGLQAAARTNLGLIYRTQDDYDQARHHLLLAREYYRQAGERGHLGNVFYNIGVLERLGGHLSQASGYLEEAIRLHREAGDYPEVARSMRHQSEILLEQGFAEAAALQAGVALEILQEHDLPMLSTPIHGVLARACADAGQWERALAAERAYGEGQRAILERHQSASLAQVRSRFRSELAESRERLLEAETALMAAQLAQAEAELARRSWQLATIGAVGLALLILVVGLVLRGRLRAQTNRELKELNEQLAEAIVHRFSAGPSEREHSQMQLNGGGAAPVRQSRPLVGVIDPSHTSRSILSIFLDQIGADVVEGRGSLDILRILQSAYSPSVWILDEGVLPEPESSAPEGPFVVLGLGQTPVVLLVSHRGLAWARYRGITVVKKPTRRSELEGALRPLIEACNSEVVAAHGSASSAGLR